MENVKQLTETAERSKAIVAEAWREKSQPWPEIPAVYGPMANLRVLAGNTIAAEIEASRQSLIGRESLASKARRLFGLDIRADVNSSTLFWA